MFSHQFLIIVLILVLLCAICIMEPHSFCVRIPRFYHHKAIHMVMTAVITSICVLWALRCISKTQVHGGIIGTESVNPYNILVLFISLACMFVAHCDTGIREAAAFWFISMDGNNGRTRLFLYFYFLLIGVNIVLGKDPIVLTCLIAVAWLISEFAASNTINEHMVGTFHGVENLTVTGGTFITNLRDEAQVQSFRPPAQRGRMER